MRTKIIKYMKRFIAIIGLIVSIISCKHDAIVPESPPVSFKNDVQPIIISNCTRSGCHGSDNPEEFTLLNYYEVMNNGEVNPGNPGGSKLYKVITGNGEKSMPPDYSLSSEQARLIYFWISQGAKNN